MNPVTIIRKKRDGQPLDAGEIEWFVGGYLRGEVTDYQMSAFLMAVYFTGMTTGESATLTEVMLHSGSVLDLSSLPGPKIDKHSTGGVGDKVSLVLAPMVAACGVFVPMISGRGLGHTGGTLDKLESIPGFRTTLGIEESLRVLADTGLVMIGQTRDVAPADRKIYALRDVTATIESFPLIASSIMSKKLAEGIDGLVLDVKSGNGAFMQTYDRALALARLLVGVGESAGKRTVAFITGMDQPLGFSVGNWLEVVEAVECLRGRKVGDLMEIVQVLGGAMVFLGGKAASIEEGMRQCLSALWSGKAYETFLRMVERQGGDPRVLEHTSSLPGARIRQELASAHEGILHSWDTRTIGEIAIALGAGRTQISDEVDPQAGIVFRKKVGDRVERGEPLAVVHTNRTRAADDLVRALGACVRITLEDVTPPPVIRSMVDRTGESPWRTPAVV